MNKEAEYDVVSAEYSKACSEGWVTPEEVHKALQQVKPDITQTRVLNSLRILANMNVLLFDKDTNKYLTNRD